MILTHYFPEIVYNNELSNPQIISNITEYRASEQQTIAKQLSCCPGRALRRFDQFSNYIYKRKETEKWLYSEFLKAGGQPSSMCPFYFVVGESQQLKNDFGECTKTIQLDTCLISHNHISFTLGDSVGLFYSSAPHQIYLLCQLEKLLSNPTFIQQQMKPLKLCHHYIEAQLWDKHYLNEMII